MCIEHVFRAKYRVLAFSTSFLLKNEFKRRQILELALASLILKNQCVCTFPSAFIALKSKMYIKRVFSTKKRVLAHLTSFLLKQNAFKRREMLVSALVVSLILHNSMHLHVSQCFLFVQTDIVHKPRFSAFNVVFAEKRF